MRIFHDEGRCLNIWWSIQTASSKKFIPLTQTHKVQESPTLELHDSGINTQWHLPRWSPCCGGQERPRFRAEGLRGLGGGFYKTAWLQGTQRCILKSKGTSFWGKDMISSDWKTFHLEHEITWYHLRADSSWVPCGEGGKGLSPAWRFEPLLSRMVFLTRRQDN